MSENSQLKHQDNHVYWINGFQVAVTTKVNNIGCYDDKTGLSFGFTKKELVKFFSFPEKVYKVMKHYSFSRVGFLCGNSIVENVLIALFKQFYPDLRDKEICEDINY